MSFDNFLIHTCTIENPKTTDGETLNAYNNAKPEYGAPLQDVRCRFVEDRKRIWSDQLQESIVKTVYKLLLPAATVIDARSKISFVTLEDGAVIKDTFVIAEPPYTRRVRSARHKTVILERIS